MSGRKEVKPSDVWTIKPADTFTPERIARVIGFEGHFHVQVIYAVKTRSGAVDWEAKVKRVRRSQLDELRFRPTDEQESTLMRTPQKIIDAEGRPLRRPE